MATRFIGSEAGERLYQKVRKLPVVDYHCHLSPREIYEDREFDNLGELWLAGDHYKWRLMRQYGVEEQYITGSASWRDKFLHFMEALEYAAGNPVYHWCKLELEQYFDIDAPLTAENAPKIWEEANRVIQEKALSPRKLILNSGVSLIATTDDVIDVLNYHRLLAQDRSFPVAVTPSFRTDRLLLCNRSDYRDYLKALEAAAEIAISGLASFKQAILNRLDYFMSFGCRMTDVGIPFFPSAVGSDVQAEQAFDAVLSGRTLGEEDYSAFLGNLFLFLGKAYRERNLVMQWHLAVWRDANKPLWEALGENIGCDCMGNDIPVDHLIGILDAINQSGGLPKTLLYTLRPSMAAPLSTIAGCYRNVIPGAAWWFCDHRRGICEQLEILAETGHLGTFPGMLTDSRSFLSYARHDYYRRLVCRLLGSYVERGEFEEAAAERLAEMLCYENAAKMMEGTA